MTATIHTPRPTVQVPVQVRHSTIMLNVEYAGCTVKVNRVNDHYLMVTARHNATHGPATTHVALYHNQTRDRWVGDYYDGDTGMHVEIGESQSLTEMATAAMLDVAWRGHDNGAW